MALKLRRGTDNERTGIVFAEGEPVFVTDTGELYIGDGSTMGGLNVSTRIELDESPKLGGNLDLNQNNIVGTGNIDITGTIRATGEIELGDGIEDNITVGGLIASSLIPDEDKTHDLGASLSTWQTGYFANINSENISTESIQVSDIYNNNSSIFYTSESSTLRIENLVTQNIWNEDSSILYENSNDAVYVSQIRDPETGFLAWDLTNNRFKGDTVDSENNVVLGAQTRTLNVSTATITTALTADTCTLQTGLITPLIVSSDNSVNFVNPIKLHNTTTAARDAIPAENGMIIYNTDENKTQVYENGNWTSLT